MSWKFYGSSVDGVAFTLNGVNVWKHKWISASDQKAVVEDPLYNRTLEFPVYYIDVPAENPIIFAASEFSNGIWGFYTPE